MHEAAAAEAQVGERNRGDVHAHGDDIARPLAAFARGVVGDGILGAGPVRLDPDRPDLVEQGIAGLQRAAGGAVVGAFDDGFAEELHLRLGSEYVDFQKTAAARREWKKFL